MIARPAFLPRPLSLYGPVAHSLAVTLRRLERHVEHALDDRRYTRDRSTQDLPVRVKRHQSVLMRQHSHGMDRRLQLGKIRNLTIAVDLLDGALLAPGESFSFWRCVGRPTPRRGFVEGMELSRGEARPGIGGGLCQISNLLFWLALHSPLEVIERHHHSFDPFPDDRRVLPFASGATVMYNYRDLRLSNPTTSTFQLRLRLGEKCLHGELRASEPQRFSYSVVEREHRFERVGSTLFRRNELWRRVIDKTAGGRTVREEHCVSNRAEVKYVPALDSRYGEAHSGAPETPRGPVRAGPGNRQDTSKGGGGFGLGPLASFFASRATR